MQGELPDQEKLTKLWTFENKAKLDSFIPVLESNDIPYRVLSRGLKDDTENGLVVSVDEGDYEEARKLLIHYRRKNTNRNRK
jgi:hypothetical protein